jgi:hypothetical protein
MTAKHAEAAEFLWFGEFCVFCGLFPPPASTARWVAM